MSISQRYILRGDAYHRIIEISGQVVGTVCGLRLIVEGRFSEAVRFQKELEQGPTLPNYCKRCVVRPAEVAA